MKKLELKKGKRKRQREEKIKQAVHTIRYAIIGLIVTIFSVTIIKILGLVFGFDLLSLITWDRITVLMNDLITKIASGGAGQNLPRSGNLR